VKHSILKPGLILIAGSIVGSFCLTASGASAALSPIATGSGLSSGPPVSASNPCGLHQVAFCDTFDKPSINAPSNTRAGQLNGVVWGTSMDTGAYPGDEIATTSPGCRAGGNVNYPGNVQICNGQLVTTVTDGGSVTSLAMYPRQPFDFAGRTGTIAFDVSNDSGGSHAAWPELWVSDQPVPDPFVHESAWQSQPRNGFGIRFSGCGAECPGGNGTLGVDGAVVVTNYRVDDSFMGGSVSVVCYGDVVKSGPGQVNHYEVRVSQSHIEVYGTNPFSGTWNPATNPLIHISSISGFGRLGFTRGLVWMEDVHYNGDKFNCPPTCQGTHAFRWDNFGFDGPILRRDLGFDVRNNRVADIFPGSGDPAFDNAYPVPPNQSLHLTVPDVHGAANASGALLVFNFYSQSVIPLNVALNGHNLSEPWPFPDLTIFSPRTIAIPIKKLTYIVPGNNTLTFSAGNYLFQVANIDLILQGAGGSCLPNC
jgi:hypothetical protein